MKKRHNWQLPLAIFLIVVQVIGVIGKITDGTISEVFNDFGYAIGFFIYGIVGVITLIRELRKRGK